MESRPLRIVITVFLSILLLSGACSTGFIAGRLLTPRPGIAGLLPAQAAEAQPSDGAPADSAELFAPFWQAWEVVQDQYVEQPVDREKLMRGAIKGMLEAVGDDYTTYMDPEEFEMLNSSLSGEDSYEGIGAWVDTTGDYLKIISPMPGSPAEKAGLRSEDLIVAVDGEDMTGVDGELVRKRVIGPAGSTVRLTIQRPGQEGTFDVEVVRASITVPSVESRMLDGNIGYVRLFIFGEKSSDDLWRKIRKA
jgi:carboxyl-terminal processing protease